MSENEYVYFMDVELSVDGEKMTYSRMLTFDKDKDEDAQAKDEATGEMTYAIGNLPGKTKNVVDVVVKKVKEKDVEIVKGETTTVKCSKFEVLAKAHTGSIEADDLMKMLMEKL